MIFSPTPISGVFVIEPERLSDERGYFARTYCADEFAQHNLDPRVAQCSVSFNPCEGTVRGLHYQARPYAEAKLVRCVRGAIHDVALDLRPDSATYLQWHVEVLSQENGLALFIPADCAHGFQTLRDATEVSYQISVPFQAEAARGVRWDDPVFGIAWPAAPARGRTISERDASYPDYRP